MYGKARAVSSYEFATERRHRDWSTCNYRPVLPHQAGEAIFVLNSNETHKVVAGSAVLVVARTHQNVMNTIKTEALKLKTIYSPPNHPPNTVNNTGVDANK